MPLSTPSPPQHNVSRPAQSTAQQPRTAPSRQAAASRVSCVPTSKDGDARERVDFAFSHRITTMSPGWRAPYAAANRQIQVPRLSSPTLHNSMELEAAQIGTGPRTSRTTEKSRFWPRYRRRFRVDGVEGSASRSLNGPAIVAGFLSRLRRIFKMQYVLQSMDFARIGTSRRCLHHRAMTAMT